MVDGRKNDYAKIGALEYLGILDTPIFIALRDYTRDISYHGSFFMGWVTSQRENTLGSMLNISKAC